MAIYYFCSVIDIMCLLFSVAFNKRVSISLSVICLYVLDFKVKRPKSVGEVYALY